ncbi:MAG: LPS-assembly protein LptD [Alphaproteobacteria bacterium]|nr:LPS-assembly protein LptD [Alphaproteobacteria bacterium]
MKKILCRGLILSSIFFGGAVSAADISFLNSDETEYKNDVVICRGNVVVVYNKKIISADTMSFDEKNDIIKAEGNVIMKDEFGNAYFANSFQAERNFKSGQATNLKIITQDKTRLASDNCFIVNGEYLLKNVIFTPCYECTESGSLTWQLKAKTVTFNPENYTEYQNAVLEAYNVPVLYTPYLTHVSSNIKRKSGFLTSKFSYTSRQGFSVFLPYLFSISNSQELIFKPIITSRIGHVPWIYYGWRFAHGEFSIDASLTGTKSINKQDPDEKIQKIKRSGYRGHVFAKLRYELNNNWRTGFNINLASDRYYLKRFSFFDKVDRTLESKVYLEGFHGRNYTMVKSSMYQSEDLDAAPNLLPMLEHRHYFQVFGGTLNFDTAFINMDFKNGRLSQKYICNPSWYKEILTPGGHILEVNTVLSVQGLKVKEETKSDYNSHFQARPQLNLTWKWPLLVETPLHNLIFTPVLGTSLSENKKYYDAFETPFDEINESNVFFNNRSISPYNVDSGKRYFYGFHADGYHGAKNIYHFALGQSFELTEPQKRVESSGLKYKKSNIVGVLDIFFSQNLTFSSSGSYSQQNKRFDRIEAGVNYSDEKFSAGVMGFKGKQSSYNPFKIQQDFVDEKNSEKKYKGIALNASYKITPRTQINCGIVLGNRFGDKSNSGKLKLLKHEAGINFGNECTKVLLQYERENKRGADLHPETTFKVVVQLKKLG